ncbi:glycoside hydrolase family 3 protein [Bacillus alkalicellulosilyticus]|uniref:glycoside hydrolase family 3 protein n=1 Tax=Alkalihalobacterium alkalicellulosilyticum TaxID=1912214 RepID=UPI000996F218|nr:glycoside hydrolase family 3 protein [Bacillus alkalicellulosilyticus]
MKKYTLDWNRYTELARTAVAEGAVLLKNENKTLPIKAGTTISIFGRSQFNYYKSGTGSGGMVNVSYVTSPLDALKDCSDIHVNQSLLQTYEAWLEENPYDKGVGWAGEPWSQKEMPVTDAVVADAAKNSDMALVLIGRTAGEDRDNSADPGSYLLTDEENKMIELVTKEFSKTVVILNVGNIIDMKWSIDYNPSAIIYGWQGGMEGGNGLVDVLTGKVNPSGKLPDTISHSIDDHPSTVNFGHKDKGIYQEDIYVGYRYFETFAKDKVLYPFGFGLSYTSFATEVIEATEKEGIITLKVDVTNTGEFSGKEVIQVYVEKPQGLLGNPSRSLVSFAKTKLLEAGSKQTLQLSIPVKDFACYDDSGVTGYKSTYILEKGLYRIYAGTDVRSANPVFDFNVEAVQVIETLSENMAPVTSFQRIKPKVDENGYKVTYENVPLRTVDIQERYLNERPPSHEYTGNHGHKLTDVYQGKISLDAFLEQLTDEDLACIVRGQGMNSPRVTPGTAGAFGGISDRLNELGIPAICCADGPSGIRMDIGTKAFSLPNGTLLASTFNLELNEELFEMTGLEMRKNRVDTLLGPGINIHRNPLNGRNFEYFSEDPYLTGKMAVAQLNGMHRVGVTGTLKHFSANNQEFHRHDINSIVSERALREIYLKGFEMAVKEGGAYSIMTTYGAVNGIWTAGLYDQNTRVLRDEWGFDGIVMTDWWAKINDEGEAANRHNTAAMVRSQNDLYMVVGEPNANPFEDNTISSIGEGTLTRGELLRSAANICTFIMRTPAWERTQGLHDGSIDVIGLDEEVEQELDFDVTYQHVNDGESIGLKDIDTSTGSSHALAISVDQAGMYEVTLTIRSFAGELAQMPVTLIANNTPAATFTFNGTGGEWVSQTKQVFFMNQHNYLKLFFTLGGLELKEITFKLENSFSARNM